MTFALEAVVRGCDGGWPEIVLQLLAAVVAADPLVGRRNYESPHPEWTSAACSAVPSCPGRGSAAAVPHSRAAFGRSDCDGSTDAVRIRLAHLLEGSEGRGLNIGQDSIRNGASK